MEGNKKDTIVLPLLPMPDVLFPESGAELVLTYGSSREAKAIKAAVNQGKIIGVVVVVGPDEPQVGRIGTIAQIKSIEPNPDLLFQEPAVTITVKGESRFTLLGILKKEPYLVGEVRRFIEPEQSDPETKAWADTVKSSFEKIVELLEKIGQAPSELGHILSDIRRLKNPGRIADAVVQPPFLKTIGPADRFEILSILDVGQRLQKAFGLLEREISRLEVRKELERDTEKQQREYWLRQQRDAINKELGEDGAESEEIKKYRAKIEQAKMPPEAEKEALEQLDKLARSSARSSDWQWTANWLDWMTDLPWSAETKDKLNIKRAKRILEEDHYGLEQVKDRTLEFLAVRKLNPKGKGPILCFIGPPGTGKTSLGKSIAKAMGRRFVRLSLGGIKDEAEIRGHRRTYIGSLPGRIIQGLKTAGTRNPVFMLDEIDKVGADFRGDPTSALLEVLDPEQNNSFSDHYIGVQFDLSNVLFIATGNLSEPIQPALRDRMEVISFSGYTSEEKLMIAKHFLVPRQIEANGLRAQQIQIDDQALQGIIRGYTQEAGVRNLEREIGNILRKIALKSVEEGKTVSVITRDNLPEFLGPLRFVNRIGEQISAPGVAIGLAYTPCGGKLLFVEAVRMEGAPGLILTGQLREVMKESAQAALSYVRANARKLGIETSFFKKHQFHIHVPEGAIPKDGPSAGVTMLVALVSLLTKRRVRSDLAMTGEITLRGLCLPVGGIKEKVLAAKEAGLKIIVMPRGNEKDLADLPRSVKEALERNEIEIKFISKMEEALEIALREPEPEGASSAE